MNSRPMSSTSCHGWWEQHGYGRQPMNDLCLSFAEGQIEGRGNDIIGPFTFRGSIDARGVVLLRKQYIGRHHVDYIGAYDGEGILSGRWHIHEFTGAWLIRIAGSSAASADDIQEYVPQR